MKKVFSIVCILVLAVKGFASGHVATASGTNVSCNGFCDGSAMAAASGGVGPYGYSWTGPASYTANTQNINSLCAGAYVVTATDSSDMSVATYTLNITEPSAVTVTVNSPTICAGTTANLMAGGATTYSWTPGATSTGVNTASASPATTTSYTVTGTTSGCYGTALSIVTVSPLPVVTVNSPTICPGQTANLIVNGATIYTWSAGATSTGANTASATPATTTSYTVTGSTGSCSNTAVSTVTFNPVPNIVLNSYSAHCSMCDGYISNSTTGGTTYSWSGPAAYTSTLMSPTNLCPGTYTVIAAGSTGCSSTATANIMNAPPPAVTISVVNAVCGMSNGSLTAIATGGTSPYAYSWAPIGGTAPTASALMAGTYTVTITDMNGCTGTAVGVVTTSPAMTTANITSVDASCGASNGSLTINGVGGTPAYTYSFYGGPFGASGVFNLLAAGAYPLTVKDANGCTYSTTGIVSNSGGPTSCSITIVNSACSSATGEINIGAVTGGTSPYTFSIDGGAYTVSVSYTGLAAGSHSVLIKDVNGCILTQNVVISNTGLPVIVADSTDNISCSGGVPGSVYISVSGGTPGYFYSWNNGSAAEDLTNLFVTGSYTVTVTDASGCSAVQSFYITDNSTLYASVSSINGSCGGLGTATVSPFGGTLPYTYSWNTTPVQTTATAVNLASGSYNCTIIDANGCIRVVYVWINNACLNVIKGNVYDDANSNCVKDSAEVGLSGRTIIATGSSGTFYGYTDMNGNYSIQTPNMNNTVSVSTYGVSYLSPTCPATGSMTVNFTTSGDTLSNNNFGYYSNPGYFNLVIHPGWSNANPGFVKHYWIAYYNASPTPQNALIRFTYDSALVYSSHTMGGVHYPSQHKIEWTLTAVPPATIWNWALKPDIYFNVPTTLSTSTNLNSYFEILPIAGDAYPLNNTLYSTEPVTGSHDPNSKAVMPKGEGPDGNILVSDSILFYTIHFQNNGNDTAHFVIVKDTLSQYLDPATIVPGAASHPYTFNLSAQGEITFTFDNIMLPDSTTDEPGSNGYFNYTIKQKANNPIGTVIANTAGIYFDYNLPVITNTTVNTIVDVTTGIETSSTNNLIKVYPNPFSESTTFVIQSDKLNETYSFEMTDVLGKKVRSINNISEKQFSVSRNELQNGIYFYKIYNAESVVGVGKLIIK